MKLISLNIETDIHNDAVLEFLKKENPDVFCVQELLEENVSFYENKLNMKCIFRPQIYIYFLGHGGPQNKRVGVGIFAKNILSSGHAYYTGDPATIEKPFEEYFPIDEKAENHVLLWADIPDTNGKIFRIATTHFTLTEKGESTPWQLETLEMLFKELDPLGQFVLCGDMNAPRGRETFNRLAEKYKDNIPPEYLTSLDQKLHRVPGLMYMVDGLFTTQDYIAENVKLVDGISDHMAIVANILKQE